MATAILLFAAASNASFGQTQEKTISPNAFKTISASLYEIQPNHFEVRVSLGALDVGSVNRFEIHIQNDMDRRILLPEPTVTCGCLSVEISAKSVEPGEFLKLGVELKTPPNPRADQFIQLVSFDATNGNQARLRLRLQSTLRGLLAFPQD